MPTSATGTWNSRQTGFTLLEVMVTLVLIGIITGFVVLSVPGGSADERLATEARRLAALIEINRQEAMLRTEPRGLRFGPTGYAFLLLNRDGEWVTPEASARKEDHALPDGMTLTLTVDNRDVDLSEPTSTPQVLLLASGEATDFRVTFSARGARGYTVSGNLAGALDLRPIQ